MRKNSIFILLFLSSLILFSLFPGCLPVTPEPVTGTISGYVAIPDDANKDLTGYSPIPGATVTIVDAEGVAHLVLTDEDGYYCFNNINIKTNTIINITKDTEGGGKLIFKDIVPLTVSSEEDYDAGIADIESTAIALVVEELVKLDQIQEDIDLDEITSSDGFDELMEDVQQAQEDNQDINTDLIDTQAEEIADNIVNPPSPSPAPIPAAAVITISAITGVTAPVTGAAPDAAITATDQYTGAVSWSPTDNPFLGSVVYTATITLTAKAGFTLTGVAANFFTVDGTAATNAAGSGEVTSAAFPETAATPVTGVSLNKATTSIVAGDTETLTATVLPAGATNKAVTWASDNESAATVDSGVLTGVSAGTAIITVTTVDGNFTATCTVTVTTPEGCFTFTSSENIITITDYDPGCGGNVVIPSTIGGVSVEYIDANAFASNALTSVIIPNSVTSIGNNAFTHNDLTSVTIGTSVTSIDGWAFADNDLTSAIIPDSVISIGKTAFGSNKLTSVTIGNSVTSIGETVFYNNQLTSVTIPDSVETIGINAFGKNSLTSVVIGANVIIDATDYTMGTNTGFKTVYDGESGGAGTYNYTDTAWVKE